MNVAVSEPMSSPTWTMELSRERVPDLRPGLPLLSVVSPNRLKKAGMATIPGGRISFMLMYNVVVETHR